MNNNPGGQSATIHQFPSRATVARAAAQASKPSSVVSLALRRPPIVEFGSWYHDEAIRESERQLKS